MDLWHWIAAAVQAVLLLVGVLLLFDTLRDRAGWSLRRAGRVASWWSPIVPIGVIAVLLAPPWAALILVAVPALIVGSLALAS